MRTQLLEKLEAIAINKERLTERLNYLVEIKVLQNKPRNGVKVKVLNRLSYKLARIRPK